MYHTENIRKVEGKLLSTFNSDLTIESQTIPENLYIFHHKCKVTPYIYPIKICERCLKDCLKGKVF